MGQDEYSPLDPEQLERELRRVMRLGLADTWRIARKPLALFELEAVKARIVPENHPHRHAAAAALKALLTDLIRNLRNDEHRTIAPTLFDLPETRQVLEDRELAAAAQLHASYKTIRRRELTLLAELVADLLDAEMAWRNWQLQPKDPVSVAVTMDYLRRFDFYGLMALRLNTLSNELKAFVSIRGGEGADHGDYRSNLENALIAFVRFSVALARYLESYHGTWRLSAHEAVERTVAIVQTLDLDQPFWERELSWLRLRLTEARGHEPRGLLDALSTDAEGARIWEMWEAWAESCECGGLRGEPDCVVHRVIGLADEFYETMNAEHLRVVEWYAEPGADRYLVFPSHLD